MIVTTTPTVEGRNIVEYKGIVFGEVVSGVNFIKDIAASFSNFFGGRSGSYEDELIKARQNALVELERRASEMGANAVVGVDIDYEVLGADNGMLMVTASGTAVVVAQRRCFIAFRHSKNLIRLWLGLFIFYFFNSACRYKA